MDPSHVGSRVRVRASVAGVPEVLEADLFAIHAHRGVAVFRRVHAHTYQKADYFFIPIAAISAFDVLGKSEKTTVANIGVSEIKRRLKDATDAEQRKIALRGVGVTEQGQRIFNELLKQCVPLRARALRARRARARVSAIPLLARAPLPPAVTRARRGSSRRSCSTTWARSCSRRTRWRMLSWGRISRTRTRST